MNDPVSGVRHCDSKGGEGVECKGFKRTDTHPSGSEDEVLLLRPSLLHQTLCTCVYGCV